MSNSQSKISLHILPLQGSIPTDKNINTLQMYQNQTLKKFNPETLSKKFAEHTSIISNSKTSS